MIGVSVAAKREWKVVLNKYNIETCNEYPFGEYFIIKKNEQEILFYRCGVRKMNSSASTQYMIDHFNLRKVIVIGTCAGIDDKYKNLDIFIPNKAVQYDCTVKEKEPLIKDSFTVLFNIENLNTKCLTGTIGTADKAVVMWNDYLEIKKNDITIADTESAAIAYVCKLNKVECIIIKGISDFPSNDNDSDDKQLDSFITNIPIIINDILDNYLDMAIETKIEYVDF